ncbi:MAG TPA: DUF882 domain-containing protein [Polyangiaceae bacterium]|jgi:uncharacterized protein YcbK (DUF882 family)
MNPRRVLLCALALTLGGTAAADDVRPLRPNPSHLHRPQIPAGYDRIVRAWHTPSPGKKAPLDPHGRPMLVLHAMYLHETVSLPAQSDFGGFYLDDLSRAAHVLREPSTGNEHVPEPRTLDLLYRIQRHFDAEEIRVMSALRTPVPGNGQGLHARGRAVDFVVPGAEDVDVARFARELGFAGVGLYPLGSFVHLDTRERSYFWIDRSGPGHRSRERGILLDVARHADDRAREEGEAPGTFVARAGEAAEEAEGEDED